MAGEPITEGLEPASRRFWWAPFAWLELSPIVTVPLIATMSSDLTKRGSDIGLDPRIGFEPNYEYSALIPTLFWLSLPALVCLVSIWWLMRPADRRARLAALVVVLLAVGRLSFTLVTLLTKYDIVSAPDGTSYLRWETTGPGLAVGFLNTVDWVNGLFVWTGFAMFTSRPRTTAAVGKANLGIGAAFLIFANVVVVLVVISAIILLGFVGLILVLIFAPLLDIAFYMLVEACTILGLAVAIWGGGLPRPAPA
ncbi:MAG TPA: hypothetical protein VIB47_12150 [Dehalococcoidia bacterium]|jgi:hypothetical protein